MKTNIILAVIFYFISIITYADGDYRIMEDILLKRDYTKFDPEYEYADYIYERCYYEIFHKDFMFEKTGIRRRRLNVGDSFVYNLYYILERNDLPNLLVVVYLEQDGKVWGFYKKNHTLDGTKIYIEATKPKDYMLAFF